MTIFELDANPELRAQIRKKWNDHALTLVKPRKIQESDSSDKSTSQSLTHQS
jgi:hypothetical protein